MAKRHDDLHRLLKSFFLATMAENFAGVALRAAREGLTHEEFLLELAQMEREGRDNRRIERLQSQSKLPLEKSFAGLDLNRFPAPVRAQIQTLRSGDFVRDTANVIAIGKPGTGKSHLAAALGHELIQQRQTVLWTPAYALVQRLLAAKRDLKLPQELAKLDRIDCLVLDDIGYVQQEPGEIEVLFTLLAERYERRSTVITTNLVFSEWDQIFKNPMTAIAAIDRVVHHSCILDLAEVESYRAEEAKKKQANRK